MSVYKQYKDKCGGCSKFHPIKTNYVIDRGVCTHLHKPMLETQVCWHLSPK